MNKISAMIAAATLAATLATPVSAATLKMATLVPAGTHWMKEFRAAAKAVEDQTEGRVSFKFYPGGVMGSDQSVLRKMRIGQLDGGALSAGSLAERYSGVNLYSLPFLFRDYSEVRAVRDLVDPVIKRELDKKGLVVLGISEGGFAYMMSDKPVQSVEDIKERKVWVPEGDRISRETFETAGISPVALPVSDVYTGLQTGLVDTVAINPSAAIALQWHSRVNALTDEPLLFIVGMMVVDKRRFSRLSSDDQTVVKTVVGDVFKRLDEANRKNDREAMEALKATGIKTVSMSPENREAWQAIASETLKALGEEGVYPVELLDRVRQRLASVRGNAVAQRAE
ncbi:MAG: TRAP transporter substrate-binding protein DctP [Pseudomonadota bacterium]